MAIDAGNVLDTLKDSRRRMERYKNEVLGEMQRRANEGELWSNEQCASWPLYQHALKELASLRDQFET